MSDGVKYLTKDEQVRNMMWNRMSARAKTRLRAVELVVIVVAAKVAFGKRSILPSVPRGAKNKKKMIQDLPPLLPSYPIPSHPLPSTHR